MANVKPAGWTDELLIREIRAGGRRRNAAWEYIYKAWRSFYLAPVLRSGGSEEEVDEVWSAVAMDVEKQIVKEDFHLTSASLRTYLIEGIIKAWSRSRMLAKRRQTEELDPQTWQSGQNESVETAFIRQERMKQLDSLLKKLGDPCRTILLMSAQGYSTKEITVEVGFQNEQSTKNKKVECKQKLLKLTDEI